MAAVLLAAALLAPALPATAYERTPTPVLSVDLTAPQGPVLRGANGSLYGFSDDGVPSDAIAAPLKLTTISQKAEGGAQHPNGDAITVSKSYFRNGGGDVMVMMQDYYAKWPYEDLGIDDYLAKVDKIVRDVAAAPHSERFVYVPFNEPDWIWYGLNTPDPERYAKNRDRFLADWKTVHRRIRALDPDARIAGPNEAYYDRRLLPDFLAHAKRHDVLPDVMTWHELHSSSLRDFDAHYAHYRAAEKAAGVGPLPVNINEYANRRDLSVPGQMVQWVSMFERKKVHAVQAYWDAAGNLAGNMVRTNTPNGGWWFFRWYAGLTGETVEVTPPEANAVDTLQGIASYDPRRRQAQVLLGGGSAKAADVAVRGVDREVFGDRVVATVSEASWSGYEGAHAAPRVVARTEVAVGRDGTVTVPVRNLRAMSAYRVVLTPAGQGAVTKPRVPWTASYEAENAAITSGHVYTQGTVDNANGYAASGTKDVGSLNRPDSKVDFTVDVPEDGTYDLAILYGNQSGAPATQRLLVDGRDRATVSYPSTENWTYRGLREAQGRLTAGRHTLTLARSEAEVTLDRIDLTRRTAPAAYYDAALADISGDPAFRYHGGSGELRLARGDSAVFDVYAPRDGYYTVAAQGASAVRLSLHGETLTARPGERLRLHLAEGNNRITATGPAVLRGLDVSGRGDATGVLVQEAPQARLAGGARLVDNRFASGGSYVGMLGNSPGSKATFDVDVPRAGRYQLIVRYANNDRRDNGHAYNTDITSRTADITAGPTTRRVTFKNTWSWNDYWTLAVPVTLSKGTNPVSFANADAWAPDIDSIALARVHDR